MYTKLTQQLITFVKRYVIFVPLFPGRINGFKRKKDKDSMSDGND